MVSKRMLVDTDIQDTSLGEINMSMYVLCGGYVHKEECRMLQYVLGLLRILWMGINIELIPSPE